MDESKQKDKILVNLKNKLTKENIKDYSLLGLKSLISGVLVSFIVFLFFIYSHKITDYSTKIYKQIKLEPKYLIALILFVFILSIIYSFLFKKYPTLRGSGLSKIMRYLREKDKISPIKSFISCFILVQISFLLGLSLGDEAPSIIVGVLAGFTFNKISRNKDHKKEIVIASAGCGFAVAFLSPFGALFYIFEDLVEKREPKVIFSSIISIFSGYGICRLFIAKNYIPGYSPKFNRLSNLSEIHISNRLIVFLMAGGVIIGLCAFLFNNLMSRLVLIMRNPSKKKYFLHIFLCTLVAVLINTIALEVHGSGKYFHDFLIENKQSYVSIIVLSTLLIISVIISYLSYMPGGFVFPIISLGYGFSALITQITMESIFGDLNKQERPKVYFLILFIFAIVFFAASYNLRFTVIFMYLEVTMFNLSTSYLILFALIPAILVQRCFNMPSLSEIFLIESKKIQPNPHRLKIYNKYIKLTRKMKQYFITKKNKDKND